MARVQTWCVRFCCKRRIDGVEVLPGPEVPAARPLPAARTALVARTEPATQTEPAVRNDAAARLRPHGQHRRSRSWRHSQRLNT